MASLDTTSTHGQQKEVHIRQRRYTQEWGGQKSACHGWVLAVITKGTPQVYWVSTLQHPTTNPPSVTTSGTIRLLAQAGYCGISGPWSLYHYCKLGAFQLPIAVLSVVLLFLKEIEPTTKAALWLYFFGARINAFFSNLICSELGTPSCIYLCCMSIFRYGAFNLESQFTNWCPDYSKISTWCRHSSYGDALFACSLLVCG